MPSNEWKQLMEGLIAGTDRELRPSAPAKTRVGLKAFRVRLSRRRLPGGRKRFEEELEAFLQSDPVLRAATKRYLGRKTKRAAERLVVVLKKVEAVVKKYQKANRSQ
jgi:hypothetical protein